jgi:hypothetical protein
MKTVIEVRITFEGKTHTEISKHIEALLKLLDARAAAYKLKHMGN